MTRFLPLSLVVVVLSSVSMPAGVAATRLAQPLVVVSNPPPVQMLVPGFTVRELPVALRNLNNLVYAPDGRLFALGYDGNVYQLKDTDGDGLEDVATDFYKNERNEIPPSIGMAWGPGGLYIASRGRIIHLRDKGDGTSELQTVTGGWMPPTAAAGSNLDAIGIAVDPTGNIYFGLGCDAWNGAYRVNKQTGLPDYNLYSERGTIIKLSPDWKRRDVVSTGLRFPVSLAFNASGDLFCSDQEGATWLPNGNPFDELLHIVPGRHYGFPPRHPRYLPGVIDEPSVFDYGPQHQSTCGVHFNEPVGGGNAIFGPSWWRGDAFVAGESRGKIWRTKLIKTAAGYVAKNELIACLAMLTIDAVPTPQGDLLVACHSGAPDWGTGPKGHGKVFKISYTDREAPQPVLAYAASPTETRIVFHRRGNSSQWLKLSTESRITTGPHVAAGDRFESFVPGYQVVKDQRRVERYDVPVVSAVLSANGQTVTLRTAPRREATHYAVQLPDGLNAERARESNRGELAQHATIDVLTDLGGVEAEWRDARGDLKWAGWLPHPDLMVARELTGLLSPEHRHLFALLAGAGKLTMRGQLDLHLMLRTATQPGAKLDFEYPAETVTVRLKSTGALQLKSSAAKIDQRNANEVLVTSESRENGWLPIEISVATGGASPTTLDVAWHTAEDQRLRALPLRRVLLPWAMPKTDSAPVAAARNIPEIAGGDWQLGKQVFASQKVACAVCHQVRGEGGVIGPDLSNLIHRDYASVLKDIVEPNAAINPDRIAYSVNLKDRTLAGGMLVDENPESITLADAVGTKRVIAKKDINSMSALTTSLMPEGLWQMLSGQEQRDLMTFLLMEPPAASGR